MKFLLECGANVDSVYDRRSPLCGAVEKRNLDLVELLIAYGADMNQRLPWLGGGTILHQACGVRNTFIAFLFFDFS